MANRIRKVDPSGMITTVAGSGRMGFSGDGSRATEARLNGPVPIAVSASGNIYFGDSTNSRIRMVDTNGIINTVAGNGVSGFAGDGGPAVMAQLGAPSGVAVNPAGHLYIADVWHHRIRKVSPPSVFSRLLSETDVAFAEENGLGYIMSASGDHKSTVDTATGVILMGFEYDNSGNLVTIMDQLQNELKIRRQETGVPFEIVSADGLVTILTIDSYGHLIRITYPDGAFYSFQYSPDGLMTTKADPNGNSFHHSFYEAGRLVEARLRPAAAPRLRRVGHSIVATGLTYDEIGTCPARWEKLSPSLPRGQARRGTVAVGGSAGAVSRRPASISTG